MNGPAESNRQVTITSMTLASMNHDVSVSSGNRRLEFLLATPAALLVFPCDVTAEQRDEGRSSDPENQPTDSRHLKRGSNLATS